MTPVDLRALLEAAPKMIPLAEFDGGIGHERCGTACLYEPVCPSPADNEARAALIVAAVNSLPHLLDDREKSREAFELILRIIRNSASAPNVLDTIAFTAREVLSALDEQEPPK